ncbi:MAG: HNH endonuclease [Candidatus Eisenbacteria bacterium]
MRRRVWQRDQGQCTFVAENGRRCEARTRLEFDHVDPVARGGDPTSDNLRLRCRAHNQYAAERAFGEAFMRGKRENGRARAAERRAPRTAMVNAGPNLARASCTNTDAPANVGANAARGTEKGARRATAEPLPRATQAATDPEHDVTPWLRALGFRADEARRAAARCEAIPDASLEERVRVALSSLAPARAKRPAPIPSLRSSSPPLHEHKLPAAPARMHAQAP